MIFKGGLRRAVLLRALGLFLLSISLAIAATVPPALAQPVSDAEIAALGPVEIQDSQSRRTLIQAPQRSFSWIATA
jgi:hypothetical protein